jgi:hypothetical protein
MASQVKGFEVDPCQLQLFRGRILRGLVLHHAVVLEHVHQGGLASVVQAQEQDLSVFVVKPQVIQHACQPVP